MLLQLQTFSQLSNAACEKNYCPAPFFLFGHMMTKVQSCDIEPAIVEVIHRTWLHLSTILVSWMPGNPDELAYEEPDRVIVDDYLLIQLHPCLQKDI
ncbi:hypothetical protein Bca4012_066789 [Brassica carinata]